MRTPGQSGRAGPAAGTRPATGRGRTRGKPSAATGSGEPAAQLPQGHSPTRADWTRISRAWRSRLDDEIEALVALREGLDSCIGCGCLSLQRCRLSNPQDLAEAAGPGAVFLPRRLRRPTEDAPGGPTPGVAR
ncbi:MAG TPA: MerR family DNA-binding protein [Kineosporiaceae bacterium]|nr:MerR family DNA-binding protein [Kineosporiaceae bacterium]